MLRAHLLHTAHLLHLIFVIKLQHIEIISFNQPHIMQFAILSFEIRDGEHEARLKRGFTQK